MREIVVITAHCSDHEREKTLRDLVISVKNRGYDVLVIAHTPIPLDIQRDCNFTIYDSENRILEDGKYLPQPWFSPGDIRRIQSALVGNARSSHLAIWRMFSIAMPFVKNLGYEIIHMLEYDAKIENFKELEENALLLNEYDFVIYANDKFFNENWIDPILLGNYFCLRASAIPEIFLSYEEERILKMLEDDPAKSCEKLLENEFQRGNCMKKLASSTIMVGNTLQLSEKWAEDYHPWAVPFFDRLTSRMGFIYWNQKEKESKVSISTNQQSHQILVPPGAWHLLDLGDFEEIDFVLCTIDGKVRNHFDFSLVSREWFKELSWRHEFE